MQDAEIVYDYRIKTNSFEGPLDVLLSLIEQRKFFVNEISLAEVTNDYISYIKSLENKSDGGHISNVSYFILIAATLILIKSKSLLPNINLTEEEDSKILDLEKRLKLYQIIKNASINIKNDFGKNIIFFPEERAYTEPVFTPDNSMSVENIYSNIQNIILNIPVQKENIPEVEIKKIINIGDIIDSLTNRIQDAINVSFKDFTRSHSSLDRDEHKVHVIVSFLAMLELVREGLVDVIQNNSFGDINITKQELINN